MRSAVLDVLSRIKAGLPAVHSEPDFSFARHTTIGSGGTAAVALSPSCIEEAAECIAFLEDNAIPYCFLGAGANVLPRDGRFEGAVIRFQRMKMLYMGADYLYAGAGVTGGALLNFAEARSITGFEPLVGIPTTVGGGVAMNAGIADCHFSDLVRGVVACHSGNIKMFSHEECLFSLKKSVFLDGIAVLGVYFKMARATQEEIKARTAHFLERRKHLPKGRSMGCTFVNPEGLSAGELIDRCGLKGRKIGQAHVSEEHANFIINEGTCSEDISRLIDEVKGEVFARSGILLREEVRRVP